MLIGVIQHPDERLPAASATAEVDGERLVLRAGREIVLQFGKARITLTRAGKILISGTYVSSRSSGMQRLQGALIEIN